jgi:hypothetical protein
VNAQEFHHGMTRLRSRKLWDSGLDAAFAEILWAKIKHYPWDVFKIAIDDTLGQHTKPTVDFLMNACSLISRTSGIASGPKIVLDDCEWCDGSGIVMMSGADKKREAPFACTYCQNGKNHKFLTAKFTDGSIATARQGWGMGWRPTNNSLRLKCEQAAARNLQERKRLPYRDDAHY